ncbi:LSU ribosomal protein L25P [Ferrimonas balearica DSM 9799]|uniref:Large ribosomal subunit protein bL25 n=1 Tax=Ferrimonas balearica (strain DSM 9799 / CCM 4581 / KCTC 23876 / PAT) TaxID=550540 RepID=E1SSA0_FERBD|nr:50S ribosomal protein L25/general stress protein Ctc [Ferrimonas balearica]ADN77032.1 LSU ribosomal protein L25P [Ferrimonas balearica DSM 9799]
MSQFTFDAEVRTEIGTGASRRLRRAERLPAVLYGADEAPVAITLDHNKVNQAQELEAFYSQILILNIDGKKVEAIVKAMQRHPYKPKLLHIDFQRVKRGEAMTATVPLHFINEEDSAGVRAGGTVMHLVNEVTIRCLPQDLPENIEVDTLNLNTGETLHLSDLKTPKGVEFPNLEAGSDNDLSVVSIQPPKGGSDEEEGDTEADSEQTQE